MELFQTQPYRLNNREGPFLQAWGGFVSVKASSERTGGAFSLLELSCPPGFATPLHIHYAEDVAIYVLEGTLTLFWGDDEQEGIAGSYFFQPRGTPHGFRVEGDTTARILYLTVPAGFDGFMREHQLQTANTEQEMAAARYKIEVLGPLPD